MAADFLPVGFRLGLPKVRPSRKAVLIHQMQAQSNKANLSLVMGIMIGFVAEKDLGLFKKLFIKLQYSGFSHFFLKQITTNVSKGCKISTGNSQCGYTENIICPEIRICLAKRKKQFIILVDTANKRRQQSGLG